MTFVDQEAAIRFFVNVDPKVEVATRNLRVAKSEAEIVILRHLGHLTAAEDQGAVFTHRYLKRDGRPLRCRVTHFTILGDLARVEIGIPSQEEQDAIEAGAGVIHTSGWPLVQEVTLPDLFPQIGSWLTDGPRPSDLS